MQVGKTTKNGYTRVYPLTLEYKGEECKCINLRNLIEGTYIGNKELIITGHGYTYKFKFDIWQTLNGKVAVLDKVKAV